MKKMLFIVALLAMSFTTLTASAKTSEIKKVKSEKVIKKAEVRISKVNFVFSDRIIQSKCGSWTMSGAEAFSEKFLQLLSDYACDQGWTSFTYTGPIQ